MEERNRRAASKWSALSMEEKKKFDDVAKKYRKPDISELSQDERERLVTRPLYASREHKDNLFYVNCILNFNIKF